VDHLSGRDVNEACRVLVIDDHEDGADMLAEAIEQFGYVTQAAYGGAAALAVAERFRPRVAIVDIGMPQMNGFDVARQLQGLQPGMVIIALSGFGTARDQQDATSAGIAHYMVKPVDFEALLALLKSICGR
jgi:DNA-binding response OmpR family regulator